MANLFVRSWKGTASLAKAFWLVFVVCGLILWLIVSFFVGMIWPTLPPLDMHNIITAIVLPYTLFSAICVWRCGKNSAFIWNVLAKIAVVLCVLGGIVALLHVLHIF